MPRDLSATVITQIASANICLALFVQIQFVSTTLYLWTGYGNLTWNGHTWTGTGTLGKVGQMPETSQLQAQGCSLSLSGIPSAILASCLSDVALNRTATIQMAFLDINGTVLDVVTSFGGRVDSCIVEEDGATSTITLGVENELITLQKAREMRYTPESQKFLYPTDTGFDAVAALQELNVVWGKASNVPRAPAASAPVSGPSSSGSGQLGLGGMMRH
jgi:hypothetical protein